MKQKRNLSGRSYYGSCRLIDGLPTVYQYVERTENYFS
jgi:hypothetical protein